MNPLTVFVVEAAATNRQRLADVMRSAGLSVQSFATGEQFLQTATPQTSGCVIMGPTADIPACQMQAQCATRGIFVGIVALAEDRMVPASAVETGTITIVSGSCRDAALVNIVRRALSDIQQRRNLLDRQREVRRKLDELTISEQQVLDRVMRGVANKTIAADLDIGLRTVELRRSTILRKLGAESFAELVQMVVLSNLPIDVPRPIPADELGMTQFAPTNGRTYSMAR